MVHNRQCYLFICLAPIPRSRSESALCPAWSGVCPTQSGLRREMGTSTPQTVHRRDQGWDITTQKVGCPQRRVISASPKSFLAINSYSHFLSINKGSVGPYISRVICDMLVTKLKTMHAYTQNCGELPERLTQGWSPLTVTTSSRPLVWSHKWCWQLAHSAVAHGTSSGRHSGQWSACGWARPAPLPSAISFLDTDTE